MPIVSWYAAGDWIREKDVPGFVPGHHGKIVLLISGLLGEEDCVAKARAFVDRRAKPVATKPSGIRRDYVYGLVVGVLCVERHDLEVGQLGVLCSYAVLFDFNLS